MDEVQHTVRYIDRVQIDSDPRQHALHALYLRTYKSCADELDARARVHDWLLFARARQGTE